MEKLAELVTDNLAHNCLSCLRVCDCGLEPENCEKCTYCYEGQDDDYYGDDDW